MNYINNLCSLLTYVNLPSVINLFYSINICQFPMHKLMPDITTNMTNKNANTSITRIIFCDTNSTNTLNTKQMQDGIYNVVLVK